MSEDVIDRLEREAHQDLQNGHEKLAMALAIEDNQLTPEHAEELLEMDELAVVQSEYYPGEEYYDRAAMRLEDWI